MATINSINNQNITGTSLTIDPGASGDSWVQLNINTAAKFRIGIYDTDDSFRIAIGNALGTSDAMVIATTGEFTMSLQSAFLAVLETTESNVFGVSNTSYTIGSTNNFTEIFDQNSDFSSYTFTSPVTGKYMLTANVTLSGTMANITSLVIYLTTSNRIYYSNTMNPNVAKDASGNLGMLITVLADMDASDTMTVGLSETGASADDGSIYGTATGTSNYTFVSGYLAC